MAHTQHHEDAEDSLATPAARRWSAPQREEALSTLATLIAATIGDKGASSADVRRALDTSERDEDWRSTLLEAEVERLQQSQSRRGSAVSACARDSVPTVPWRCPVCAAPQQVADARKVLRERRHAAEGQPKLPCAPTCKKCGFSTQAASQVDTASPDTPTG